MAAVRATGVGCTSKYENSRTKNKFPIPPRAKPCEHLTLCFHNLSAAYLHIERWLRKSLIWIWTRLSPGAARAPAHTLRPGRRSSASACCGRWFMFGAHSRASRRNKSSPYGQRGGAGSGSGMKRRDGWSFLALTRACCAGAKLYVGNLAFSTSWQALKDHMRKVGPVVRVDIMENADGRSKVGIVLLVVVVDAGTTRLTRVVATPCRALGTNGGGRVGGSIAAGCDACLCARIVEFANANAARKAISQLNGTTLDGRDIVVREVRGWSNRGMRCDDLTHGYSCCRIEMLRKPSRKWHHVQRAQLVLPRLLLFRLGALPRAQCACSWATYVWLSVRCMFARRPNEAHLPLFSSIGAFSGLT